MRHPWATRGNHENLMAAVILVNYKMCSYLHYIMLGIYYFYVHACFAVRGIQWNHFKIMSLQNTKWPLFSPTIAKIEHNLIAFCYIYDFILSIPMFYHIRT